MQPRRVASDLVRAHGKPDLFLTMTCSPNWNEIMDALPPGRHCPWISVRVFRQKMKALLRDLNHILGFVDAYTYVVEFQTRGLLHAHIVVFLEDADNSEARLP